MSGNARMGVVQAGALRHRVTFQAYTEADSGATGEPTKTWADSFTCWAAIRPVAGTELLSGDKVQGVVTHEIEIRNRTGVEREMRVVFGSRTFNVLEVVRPDERAIKLIIRAEEAV